MSVEPRTVEHGQVDFAGWLFRLLTWDGVLPVCVVVMPSVIETLLPGRRGAIELTAVSLPIVAFLVRIFFGSRHIASNNCGPAFRRLQYCIFGLAVFILVFIDAVLILSHVMPRGALFATREDRIIWAIIASCYVVSMAIAMYPGRAKSLPEVFRPDSN